MSAILETAALGISAAGIVAAVGVAVRAGLRAAVPVLLDFLLAAGLLRLTAGLDWDRIATTAVIVAIRHVVGAGLAVGSPPAGPWRHRVPTRHGTPHGHSHTLHRPELR